VTSAGSGRAAGSSGAEPAGSSSFREDAIKPTPTELGIDPDRLAWERSGEADGSIEVAFPAGPGWACGDWVLMRVVGDPDARVLVFDRNEWACFLDGARKGEFDHAAELASGFGPGRAS
jgi:hypothetical protein